MSYNLTTYYKYHSIDIQYSIIRTDITLSILLYLSGFACYVLVSGGTYHLEVPISNVPTSIIGEIKISEGSLETGKIGREAQ